MAFQHDAQIAEILAAIAERGVQMPIIARGDWSALRQMISGGMQAAAQVAPIADVEIRVFTAVTGDGAAMEMRWYRPRDCGSRAAVVYAHGGGMIGGAARYYDASVAALAERSGVPFLSVDYRLAPEVTGDTPARDCFAGLQWLLGHAGDLDVDPARIAVMGDSAGGGVAAGAAILARDHGIALVRQILIYPMLDDRNVEANPLVGPFASWSHDHNFTGWSALMGDAIGGDEVPHWAAPARLVDFKGLAPAYIEVGELDIFRNESVAYAQGLYDAGVSAELHVLPGAFHGFDRLAPDARITQRAMGDRLRVIQAI